MNDNANSSITIPIECKMSATQILSYAGFAEERAELFLICLDAFNDIKDKSVVDRETTNIRDAIAPVLWELYEAAARRLFTEGQAPIVVHMFLRYGYIDERLLTPGQVEDLKRICELGVSSTSEYQVFNIVEWLARVYKMERDPSVNEYGQDYFEVFREKRKRGEVTDRDKIGWDSDRDGRLKHEINGLTRLGQRLAFGKMSGYFPILYKEMITGDLNKAVVTPQRIKASMDKILSIDFSAFHREVVYHQPEKGIVQQLIMKQVLPDFVLVPTFGIRGVMWQELTGRQSNTAGRFVLPAFCADDLDLILIDLVAKFKWYLSKVVGASMRKDTVSNSLYSDYTSYLQFYKKNRDLSTEAKDKIKTQLDRYRNNMVEIFSGDYRIWILFESKGLMRLNKVSREILFKYCPFPRNLRDHLEKQPLYNQMITQYNNLCEREIKTLEARYTRMNKSGGPIDSELTNNINYYRS